MTIGQRDKILVEDQLHGMFLALFENFLTEKVYNEEESGKENSEFQNNDNRIKIQSWQSPKDLCFHDLSPDTIDMSVFLLKPYYKEGHRHNFALLFSGTAFHYRVSEMSAVSIMERICNETSDIQEKQDRIYTLRSTYKNGIEGKPVTGGPSLSEFIMEVSECEESVANDLVKDLKKRWQKDAPKEISISKAKREKSGHVKVRGTIIGLSPVYQLIKSVKTECQTCSWQNKTNYKIPKFKVMVKESGNCPSCSKDDGFSNTVTANMEYVTTVDLELQDMDAPNEIERLPVKVFENDTHNIAAGEIVNIVGDLHIVRKNDSIKNKLETVLFADSVDYVKRQELTLTEKDIKEIEDWKNQQEEQGNNLLDSLVSLFAPELIDLDKVKRGVLLTCVNAGIKNMDKRFPKRMRINTLLIGDPGLAKTSILEKATRLIPNSQYAGGQSSTGLSLTAQISKEDGGMHTLRFGPVVLAKDSLCAINEIGQLPIEEHKHLLDCMEENGISMAKYGFSTKIEAHPSIVATANPVNNKWQNSESVSMREFPTLSQVIQRFDLIFIFRENTTPSYLGRYVDKRKKTVEDYKNGLYEGNEDFLVKYILYARSLKPIVSERAYFLLKEFYINMGKSGITGLPRKLDSLLRITISIAKLKLKNVADVEDAQQVMLFYNDILKDFNQASVLATNPRDFAYGEIRKAVKENNGSAITLTDAAILACSKDKDVKFYLLGKRASNSDNNIREYLKLNNNWHLKEILEFIKNDDCLQIILDKPITIRWKGETNDKAKNTTENIKNVRSEIEKTPEYYKAVQNQNFIACSNNSFTSLECDECDECDSPNKKEGLQKKIYNEFVYTTPHIKDKNDNPDIHDCENQYFIQISNNKTNSLDAKSTPSATINIEHQVSNGAELRPMWELQKPQLWEYPSHTSNTSHSKMVGDGVLDYVNISSNNNQYRKKDSDKNDNSIASVLRIFLKHSPYAEVYTNPDSDKDTLSGVETSCHPNLNSD